MTDPRSVSPAAPSPTAPPAAIPSPSRFNTSEQCWVCSGCGTFLKQGYQHSPDCPNNRESASAGILDAADDERFRNYQLAQLLAEARVLAEGHLDRRGRMLPICDTCRRVQARAGHDHESWCAVGRVLMRLDAVSEVFPRGPVISPLSALPAQGTCHWHVCGCSDEGSCMRQPSEDREPTIFERAMALAGMPDDPCRLPGCSHGEGLPSAEDLDAVVAERELAEGGAR